MKLTQEQKELFNQVKSILSNKRKQLNPVKTKIKIIVLNYLEFTAAN